jgi:hypothetical protein
MRQKVEWGNDSNKNDTVLRGKQPGDYARRKATRLFREKQQCDSAEEGKEGAR